MIDLAKGENVSFESIPSCWVYPFATEWGLYHSTEPSELYLICLPGGRGTTNQVLLVFIAINSSFVASFHR